MTWAQSNVVVSLSLAFCLLQVGMMCSQPKNVDAVGFSP